MNHQVTSISIFLLFILNSVFSQETTLNESQKTFSYKGFSGGMFIHSGYSIGKTFQVKIADNSYINTAATGGIFGLGGNLGFHFGKNMRFGGEGYVTNTYYENGSRFRIGWGGLFAEYMYRIKRLIPYIGVTIGGGKFTNTYFPEEPSGDLSTTPVVYKKKGIFIITPYIGAEYVLTEKLHIRIRFDYLFAPTAMIKEPDFSTGVRFYVGLLFCK